MKWEVLLHEEFESEFNELAEEVQDELLAYAKLLEVSGPSLRRPHADTLKGSRYANMKELRFKVSDGVSRVAFAFDSQRKAILLVAGNKAGTKEKRFYRQLIIKADQRFDSHLNELKKQEKSNGEKA
ncbi:type II toxin-antitoxin system RelE/ParE family toxin [Gloeocapsa sp. PCC 73106]|uniref:type II toxin-antitoxin system RelE/ParE family toxin n=1 Tax=Gloeocapsa sp. PCC 73106 TaxID=102232 RepID=UPI0002AB9C1A|nr:type II toxin-antitoxin system RelE/ParE family toxin [Gloeocapsa sp. PCC 73106]ELR97066.1 hypothetical protein GLO73106DRAFT_00008690 [Gloeocapsa sp. PCC 73106]